MRLRYTWIVLVLIVTLAAVLRFYQLGHVPTSLNADEAAIGYNAYSILKTGKDEYNKSFPLLFQSFDDYKLPVYIYLTVPSIAIFGLNDFAIRFSSALFGTLTVFLTYFLVKELFRFSENREQRTENRGQRAGDRMKMSYADCHMSILNAHCSLSPVTWLPLLSALLLAISPWHLQFSRSAYEANVALFFIVLGITCLLAAIKNKWLFIVGFIALALSVWSYHSSRIFIPLILISYSIVYLRDILKNKLAFLSGAFVCIAICVPLLLLSFSSTALVRARGVSALDDPALVKRNVSWRQADIDARIPYSNIFHNHRLVNIPIIIKGYLDHYNPNFFFSELVQAKYRAPGMGLLYLWELPFLLIGIFILLRSTTYARGARLLFCWFLFAPIAASVTHMLPHPVRTLIFLPTLQIFTAYGILSILNWIKNREQIAENNMQVTRDNEQGTTDNRQKTINNKQNCFLSFAHCHLSITFCSLFSVICVFSVGYYLHQYHVHMPIDYALDWQYGHEQVVEKVTELQDTFDTVVVSTTLDQPYIFFLYYLRYDPSTYLRNGGTVSGKFDEERNAFSKYAFHSYMKAEIVPDPHTLYVGTPGEKPPGTYTLLDVKDPSGNSIYVLFATTSKIEWNSKGFKPYLE